VITDDKIFCENNNKKRDLRVKSPLDGAFNPAPA